MKNKHYHRYFKTNDKKEHVLYMKQRNQSKTACKKSYSQLEKSLSEEVKTNLKAFFKYTSKKLNYSRTIPDLKQSDEIISQNQKKAEIFNAFFTSVFAKESATTPEFKTPSESNISCVSHCVKSLNIRSFSGPYFPAFVLNTERYSVSFRLGENRNQKNSKYGQFLGRVFQCRQSFEKI